MEEEGDKDEAFSAKCCFIRTSSFRRTMRGKKSGRCKKSEQSRNLVSSLLGDILEMVVERPTDLPREAPDANTSARLFPQLENLQVGSPELRLTTRLSSSTPCHPDSVCRTPSSYRSFLFEPSLCRLSKEDAHNAHHATVLDTSVSSDGGSFAGDVLRALDEKLCVETPNKCGEPIFRSTPGASTKPSQLPDSAVLEKRIRSPSRRGDRIALISPAPFRASLLPKEMPKAKVEMEILRRQMVNSPSFPGRYSFFNILAFFTGAASLVCSLFIS